ncbi:hypothetical protein L9F63_026382, partial [Diploptera punctata]
TSLSTDVMSIRITTTSSLCWNSNLMPNMLYINVKIAIWNLLAWLNWTASRRVVVAVTVVAVRICIFILAYVNFFPIACAAIADFSSSIFSFFD